MRRPPRTPSSPTSARRWTACARSIAETRLDVPAGLPPMAGGLVRLSRLRHGPADRAAAASKNPDVLGVPEAVLLRPTLFAIFDNVQRRR